MAEIWHVEGLIKSIKDELVKQEDGSYKFKHNHESMIVHTEWSGKELDFDPIEEICKHFEDEIVSIIPNAVIIITDTFSCEVIISDTNKVMRKYNLMKQQIDFYDAIRTLFFPTLKELLVKIGTSEPEWLYFPSSIEVKKEQFTKNKKDFIIKIKKGNSIIQRAIDGTAIDFLKEDIKYYLEKYKFRNPFPKENVLLPREDITIEQLQSKPRSRKGFYVSDFYSSSHKIKYLKSMLESFFEYYTQFIYDNFFFIRNEFHLFKNLPLKMSVYLNENFSPSLELNDISFNCLFEKLSKTDKSIVEFHLNEESKYNSEKHIFGYGSSFLNYAISYKNYIPFLYDMIRYELEDFVEKIENYTIFEDFKPFEEPVESWVQVILKTEKKGGETLNVELKKIPTESKNKDGKRNDIYGHINALENGEGGYIFIGVDDSEKGLDRITGLEHYMHDNSKTLDMIKRETIDKCFKYLHKFEYRIDANQYKGKSLIRIKVNSNQGKISTFYPKNGDPCAFIRLNGKKKIMSPEEITKRAMIYQKL